MAGALTFRLDSREVNRALVDLGSKAPRVLTRSLNRTINSVRTLVKRGVAKDSGIKISLVNKQMSIKKATFSNQRAILKVSRKAIPVIQLGAKGKVPSRGKGGGVTYRFGGQRRRLPHSFIANIGGRKGVFTRKTRARKPTRERFGPSIATFFKKRLPEARSFAMTELVKNIRAGLKFSGGA